MLKVGDEDPTPWDGDCTAKSPNGFLCTWYAADHPSDFHVAGTLSRTIVDVWPVSEEG